MHKISIIIPVLNEAATIEQHLHRLRTLQKQGHEVIVADGGSTDGTLDIARRHADRVITSGKGRALQMNAGAETASGEIFLFLHADTALPTQAEQLLQAGAGGDGWGYFALRLSGKNPLFRVIEFFINQRSRLSRIGTGDQAIFITRELFRRVDGYDEIPLMEDIALCKKLRKICTPVYLHAPVLTSSRRWEAHGIVATVVKMWRLRLAYFLGADPARLAKKYDG